MGVRFACHVCGKQLNIKRELAGRRGVCPACSAKFRIPREDSETSAPVEEKAGMASQPSLQSRSTATAPTSGAARSTASAAGTGGVSPSAAVAVEMPAPVDDEQQVAPADQGVETPPHDSRVVDEPGFVTLLDEEPDAAWYVRPPSGGQYGPANGEILKQWIEEGRVAATALLWRDGWPQWRDASEVLPELAARLPNGRVASRVRADDAPVKTATAASGAAQLSGQLGVGTQRRSRSMRRVVLIGVLTAVAAALVGVLLVLMYRSGG